MSSSSFVALSRTARAGAHGKNDHRLSADLPGQLMDDIFEALEAYREHVPTATRSEVVREIIDHDLNGRIAALTRAFPGARTMSTDAAVTALAALEGKTVEEYRRWVLDMHIFGRLHVAHDSILDGDAGQSNGLNGAGAGASSGGGR